MKLKVFISIFVLLLTGCASDPLPLWLEISLLEEKGCDPISEMTAGTPPIEMIASAHQCFDQDRIIEGQEALALSFVYGRFDTLRVSDEENAVRVIPAVLLLYSKRINSYSQDKQTKIRAHKLKHSRLCQIALEIGKPAYYPEYMLHHGLDRLIGSSNSTSVKSNFDTDKAWDEILKDYVKCPKSIYPAK